MEKRLLLLVSLLAGLIGVLSAAIFRQFFPSLLDIWRSYANSHSVEGSLDSGWQVSNTKGPEVPAPPPRPEKTPTQEFYIEPPKPLENLDFSQTPSQSRGIIAAKQTLLVSALGPALHVRITSSPRCMEGDMDLISGELKKSEKKRLLFTVEPLLRSTFFPPQVREITEGQFERGTTLSFSLPHSDKPLHVGIFVCSDDAGDGRCRRKSVTSLDQISLNQFAHADDAPSSEPPTGAGRINDRTYFFEYAVVQGATLQLIETELSAENYQKLVSFLLPLVSIPEEALALVREVRRYNRALRSMPASTSSSFLVVDLPHMDPGICQISGPQPLFSQPPKPEPQVKRIVPGEDLAIPTPPSPSDL